jgi:hypothetical protein
LPLAAAHQPENPRHRGRFRAPRAPQPEYQSGDRCGRMAVYFPQIDRPACPAARAKHVKPRCSRDQGGPDRRRPQHVTAGSELLVPALDDGLRAAGSATCRLAAKPLNRYSHHIAFLAAAGNAQAGTVFRPVHETAAPSLLRSGHGDTRGEWGWAETGTLGKGVPTSCGVGDGGEAGTELYGRAVST